jgi:hypothetical protein
MPRDCVIVSYSHDGAAVWSVRKHSTAVPVFCVACFVSCVMVHRPPSTAAMEQQQSVMLRRPPQRRFLHDLTMLTCWVLAVCSWLPLPLGTQKRPSRGPTACKEVELCTCWQPPGS